MGGGLFWVSAVHFARNFQGCSNLNQLALAYPWAPFGGTLPSLPVGHQLWPKRKEPALDWFDRMNGTAAVGKKRTLKAFLLGLTQTAQLLGAVKILGLKGSLAHVQIASYAMDVVFTEINVATHFTATGAATLALKSQGAHGGGNQSRPASHIEGCRFYGATIQ